MLDMTPEQKKWKVFLTYRNGTPMYFVSTSMDPGDAYKGIVYKNVADAEALRDGLNRKEGKDGDNSKSK